MQKNCDTCKYGEFGNAKCVDCVSTTYTTPSHWEAADFYEPDSNADRIRAMSDEELAKHLNKLTDSYPGVCRELPECHADLEADRDIPLERCEGCWVHWLQQPAEVAE